MYVYILINVRSLLKVPKTKLVCNANYFIGSKQTGGERSMVFSLPKDLSQIFRKRAWPPSAKTLLQRTLSRSLGAPKKLPAQAADTQRTRRTG